MARLRQRLLGTMSASDVAPQVIYDAYQKNLTVVPGPAGAVALSFCDSASTVAQQLLRCLIPTLCSWRRTRFRS